MFRDVSLPDLSPEERTAVYAAATSTLCQLHSFDIDKLNLGDFGRKVGYSYRQVCTYNIELSSLSQTPST